MPKEKKANWQDEARETLAEIEKTMNGWNNVMCVEYLDEILSGVDELRQSFGEESRLFE